MIACSHAFVQVVDKGKMRIVQVLTFFHDTDAPVEIGREAIAEIVWFHQVSAGEKSLMANQHAFLEAFPVKLLGSRQASHPQEMAFLVYNSSFSVNHVRKLIACKRMYNLQECVVFVQFIAGIEKTKIITGGQTDSLVHGII